MSNEVKQLLGRALTRLLNGDKQEFKKLAIQAEDKYKKDPRLYVTVRELVESKQI